MKLITHTGSHAEGRWIMGGHYGRAGLGETAAHGRHKLGGYSGRAELEETAAQGGHRLGGQQPVEMERKVDGVAAESGDAQKLRMRIRSHGGRG